MILQNKNQSKIPLSTILLLLIPFLSFSQWEKLGNNIIGGSGESIGNLNSLAIDATGQTIAFGSPLNADNGQLTGVARVYDWTGTDWMLRTTINGSYPDTEGTGGSVSLSADGNTLAVGSPIAMTSLGFRTGLVTIYDWDGADWMVRGTAIEGEGNPDIQFALDVFGGSINLSADGNYIVISGKSNTPEVGVVELSGHARVYNWDDNQWTQMGTDIDGQTSLESFGHSVSINNAGNVVAIAGHKRNLFDTDGNVILNSVGYVRVLEWDGADWEDRGTPFFGTIQGENLGSEISLSADGNTIAIGAPNIASTTEGAARIYDWDGMSWIQRGQDITGAIGSQFGTSIDLSPDGNIVAVGAPWFNATNSQVRVFRWANNNWEQIDNAIIDTENSNSAVGSGVELNADGSIIAIGASGFETDLFIDQGMVNVFRNQTLVNTDNLDISKITYYPNPTTDHLFIQSTSLMKSITIFTLDGRSVKTTAANEKAFTLNMSDLLVGTYFVKIQSEEKIQMVKVVKL